MSAELTNFEVLVVDDSPVYRKLVEQVLSAEPYVLRFARNGAEAMRLFLEHSPCIVITDWMMPDFSGLELCQRIRAENSRLYTYIILMTSNTEKENLVKALGAGADDYLTKPFDPGEMLARIGVGRRISELNRELDAKSRKLEEAARTDPLTGLPKRRAIEEWTAKQLRGAARHGFRLWVVLGDIDNFKTINDTFGHDAGDIVLKRYSEEQHARLGHLRAPGRRRVPLGADARGGRQHRINREPVPGAVCGTVVRVCGAERERHSELWRHRLPWE